MSHIQRLKRVNLPEIIERYHSDSALTIAEFCVLVGISISTFYELCRNGQAPRQINVSPGSKRRSVRITAEAVHEWMASRDSTFSAS